MKFKKETSVEDILLYNSQIKKQKALWYLKMFFFSFQFWILLVTIFNGFPRFVSGAYLIQACGRDLDSALFGICRGRFNTAHDGNIFVTILNDNQYRIK